MERLGVTDTGIATKKTWQQPKTSSVELTKLLTVLATARQATLTEAVLATYCAGLQGFLLVDLRAAVTTLSLSERPEGRTAMPTLAEMVTACQRAAQARYEAASRVKEQAEAAYRLKHPERFCTWKEVMEDRQMMVDACESAFGTDWRRKYRGVDLTAVYEKAMDA